MKELLRDRIDVLMENASSGDSAAQLKLAKDFYRGHLVERSIELAKYWSFKAVVSGNNLAPVFYQNIVLNPEYRISHIITICDKFKALAIIEGIVGFLFICALALIGLDENLFFSVMLGIMIVGLLSYISGRILGWIGSLINNLIGKAIGTVTGVLVIHIVALWLILTI